MNKNIFRMLIATSALTTSFPVLAQQADDQAAVLSDEIIVTARRDTESVQDIPVSVQVVTGDSIQKLAITQAEELSKLAPGLTFTSPTPSVPAITLRGVTWAPGSGTPATPIYYNEIPFDPSSTIQAIFDIGQIEVLRGPQGTRRGAPSISGAVTITTRRPDLSEVGGYVQAQYGSADHLSLQGAINVPIIADVLAIRIAGNYEKSEADRVKSVNSSVDPKYENKTVRISARFEPTDTLRFDGMFQRRDQTTNTYRQVVGSGSPGFAPLGIPANFNGPALTQKDYASVMDLPGRNHNDIDLATLNATWHVLGHELTYNFGKQWARTPTNFQATDFNNLAPGYENFQRISNATDQDFEIHELRLSSERSDSRPFDYDVGYFRKRSGGVINFAVETLLSGALGRPGALPGAVTTPNSRYVLASSTDIALGQKFSALYGNVEVHIGDSTELSGGVSHLRDRVTTNLQTVTGPAFAAFSNPLLPLPAFCPFAGPGIIASPVYTGLPTVCEAPVPAGVGNSSQSNDDKYKATIYNFSLSHKFSEAVLVYATTGSSFRTGLPAIANIGLPPSLTTPAPERAKSYEFGVKTSWGNGIRINADVFQLDYKNQLTAFEFVPYFNTVTNAQALTSIAFYRNVDARVRGVEVEIAAKPLDNLSLGANFSYTKITSRGGNVPCNDPSRPVTATNPINLCPSAKGQTLNQTSPFQATINGSYTVPVGSIGEGYFRFNVSYQGRNPNFGNFPVAGSFTKTPSYALVDLFAGLTGGEGAWDLGVYAKNVFNQRRELTRQTLLNNIYAPFSPAPGGYDGIRSTLPREIGVTLRYAFGSR